MSLFERGNICLGITEQRTEKLEMEKEGIKQILEGDKQTLAVIRDAESELDSESIKCYVDRFEELLSESYKDLMREFLKTFVSRIELWGRERGKIKGRKIHIHGQLPAFTRIESASPRGIEPLLQE